MQLAHIDAYLKIPDVEIAAFCDVDGTVVERGCQTIEKAGKKRPAMSSDYRKPTFPRTSPVVTSGVMLRYPAGAPAPSTK